MSNSDADLQSIMVVSEADNRKFKMVMRGDLHKLAVSKIKRYLHKTTNIPPEEQVLTFNGRVLSDEMLGEDYGLSPNASLKLSLLSAVSHSLGPDSRATPNGTVSALQMDVEGRDRQRLAEEDRLSFATRSQPTHLGGASDLFERAQRRIVNADNGPSSALASGSLSAIPPAGTSMQGTVRQLEAENSQLRDQVVRLQGELASARELQPRAAQSLMAHAKVNLVELGKDLGMHLAFDANLTCVVGADERNTILITFDAPTERLYLYSTLLSFIPEDFGTRMQLYETLLEGAMLGRDMAGGGCGISLSSGIVLMSTSIDLRHCDRFALRDAAPPFVECLLRWRNVVAQIVPVHSGPRGTPTPGRGAY